MTGLAALVFGAAASLSVARAPSSVTAASYQSPPSLIFQQPEENFTLAFEVSTYGPYEKAVSSTTFSGTKRELTHNTHLNSLLQSISWQATELDNCIEELAYSLKNNKYFLIEEFALETMDESKPTHGIIEKKYNFINYYMKLRGSRYRVQFTLGIASHFDQLTKRDMSKVTEINLDVRGPLLVYDEFTPFIERQITNSADYWDIADLAQGKNIVWDVGTPINPDSIFREGSAMFRLDLTGIRQKLIPGLESQEINVNKYGGFLRGLIK